MLHNLIFFFMVFVLRNVDDTFNINRELRNVCIVSTVCLTLYTYFILFLDETTFVILGYCQYFLAIMSFALLYLSAWKPILRTYEENRIIPFALNLECI